MGTDCTCLHLADAATEKANSKQETAQKSAERAEKRSRKKAKTAEITRRRNQENKRMHSIIYYVRNTHNVNHDNLGPLRTQPVDHLPGARTPIADQDPSVRVI
jgi:hypothetical protein